MQRAPENESYEHPAEEKSNLKGDRWNIFWLTFMYMLQGVLAGLSNAMPLVLQNRGIGYADQVSFSVFSHNTC